MSTPNPTEYEYITVDVTRKQSAIVYLKVPVGWRPSGRDRALIGQAAVETCYDDDWDSYGWERDVDVDGHAPVEEKEAIRYQVFDVVEYLNKK